MTRYVRNSSLGRALTGIALGAIAAGLPSLRRDKIEVLDIGGRGGLSHAWHWLWRFGLVLPTFVEPDPDAARRIAHAYPGAKTVHAALWSTAGPRDLHITSHPDCSSILLPMPDARLPNVIKDMLSVSTRLEVGCSRADVELERLGVTPEIVKIDVQGGELEVLRGFGEALQHAYCVELEVAFMHHYRDQPLFDEVYTFMVDQGFGLFDLQVFGVRQTQNAVQANAYFCRRDNTSARGRLVESVFRRVVGFSNWP
jgi:FkbM family methyltransferase